MCLLEANSEEIWKGIFSFPTEKLYMSLSAKDLSNAKRGREDVVVLQTEEMAKRFQIA